MRIAFVIHEMSGGGAERVISVLANNLVEKGIDISILMTAGNSVEYELAPQIHVRQVGEKAGKNPFVFIRRIINLSNEISRFNYDAIIAFTPETGLFTLLANGFRGTNVYISERSNPSVYKHKLLRNISYFTARKVIFQTESARKYFKGRIYKNGVVIGNPLVGNLPQSYLGTRMKKVVSAGRLGVEKNYPLLIDAFIIFHDSHPDYTLHIMGKGDLRSSLQKQIDLMGASEYVTLEGFHNNVNELIRDATMFVMTSDYEGMPNALMEAMAIGLPVISTDCPIGGPRELIKNGQNGLLVKCNDVMEVADAMAMLVDNPELADRIGRKASEIREIYNAKAICEKWIEAII